MIWIQKKPQGFMLCGFYIFWGNVWSGGGFGSPSCSTGDTKDNPVTSLASPCGEEGHEVAQGCTTLQVEKILTAKRQPSRRLVVTDIFVTYDTYRDPSLSLRMTSGRREGKYVTLTLYSSPPKAAIPQPSGRRPVKPKNPLNLQNPHRRRRRKAAPYGIIHIRRIL